MIHRMTHLMGWKPTGEVGRYISSLLKSGYKELRPETGGKIQSRDFFYNAKGDPASRYFVRVVQDILIEFQRVSRSLHLQKSEILRCLTHKGQLTLKEYSKFLEKSCAEHKKAFQAQRKRWIRATEEERMDMLSSPAWEPIEDQIEHAFKELEPLLSAIRTGEGSDWFYTVDVGLTPPERDTYLRFLMAVRYASERGPWKRSGGHGINAGRNPITLKEKKEIKRISKLLKEAGAEVIYDDATRVEQEAYLVKELRFYSPPFLDEIPSAQDSRFRLKPWSWEKAYELVLKRKGSDSAARKIVKSIRRK